MTIGNSIGTFDDVTISEIPDNAMNITEHVQGGWWVNYLILVEMDMITQ